MSRIDVGEFKAGMEKLGSTLTPESAQAEFDKVDTNKGGQILFKEFCRYVSQLLGSDVEGDDVAFKDDTDRAAAKKTSSPSSSLPAGVEKVEGLSEFSPSPIAAFFCFAFAFLIYCLCFCDDPFLLLLFSFAPCSCFIVSLSLSLSLTPPFPFSVCVIF